MSERVRKIIEIDQDKCNGCGVCLAACHEGAIELVDGKARLVGDEYCDGLGDCLPECPTGAIKIIEREAVSYNEESVERRREELAKDQGAEGEGPQENASPERRRETPCSCPGASSQLLSRDTVTCDDGNTRGCAQGVKMETGCCLSELRQWPIQLALAPSGASYFKGADLLIAADCTAYAYGSFHQDFIAGRITLIGCPKLDDHDYLEKLTEIFRNNTPKSITVVRMEVPCCGGLVQAVKGAMLKLGMIVPYNEVLISTDGRIIDN